MPLSDHEQKLLQEIESALYADDPKFFRHVSSSKGGVYTTLALKRMSVYVVMFIGVFLLIGGVFLPKYQGVPLSCVIGFLIVVIGIFLLSRSPRVSKSFRGTRSFSQFSQKMENRFRRRFL